MNVLFNPLQYEAKIIIFVGSLLTTQPPEMLIWVSRQLGFVMFFLFSELFRNETRFDGIAVYEKIASKYNWDQMIS